MKTFSHEQPMPYKIKEVFDGLCKVDFNTNIEEYLTDMNETHYKYDTIEDTLNYRENMSDFIDRNYDVLLGQAVNKEIEKTKENKINELKENCNQTIISGFDTNIKDGEIIKHYNLGYEDQINIESLKNNIALGLIPDGTLEYYAAGEPCEVWENAKFLQLYQIAMGYKVSNIKRCKELVEQVKNCTSQEEVDVICW